MILIVSCCYFLKMQINSEHGREFGLEGLNYSKLMDSQVFDPKETLLRTFSQS